VKAILYYVEISNS